MSDYSDNHMIVPSSDWTDYNDVLKLRESKYYCIVSNGCSIIITRPVKC